MAAPEASGGLDLTRGWLMQFKLNYEKFVEELGYPGNQLALSLKEQVRVSETIYLDKPYIDFRIFARKADGEYIPTKKGITISKDLAKFLKEAFNKIN